ncbi:MAG: DNA-directed RNA polymerase subunit alpha [bacterium]
MIPLPLQPKIIEKDKNRAVFQIEELWPGYGVTIGNSLRRVLLSSLEGAAITKAKITGVQHEFSTIPGVIEDVITIMINLKGLRFKIFGDEPQRGRLSVKGEKKISGADFEFPSQLELINGSEHIATLTDKNASLEMEIEIERGMGYRPRDIQKNEKVEIGELRLDAFFTPVRKVNYQVENMRVGDRTDFDKVTMEIETDGTISPEESFRQAAEILQSHFSLIAETFKKAEKKTDEKKVKKEAKPKKEGIKENEEGKEGKIKIEDLPISVKVMNILLKNNIKTIEALAKKSEENISALDGLGAKGVAEIKKALKKAGLELK